MGSFFKTLSKLRHLLTLLFIIPLWLNAQVTTTPDFPSADEQITITYDATLGASSLQGANKVYMHSGVILDSPTSTNWQNVVGNWGQDDGIGLMTQVSGTSNKWEITLTPRDYYSVDAGVDIFRIGMVFRNEDGSKEGKNDSNQDIFVEINNGQFSMIVDSPIGNYKFYNTSQTIDITVKTSQESTIELTIDGFLISSPSNVTILETTHDVILDGQVHLIELSATNGTDIIEKTFSYSSTPTTVGQPLPQGVVNGVNYNDNNTSVTLVLEAPFKQNVYVLGDFNNWLLDNDYLMFQDGENFWLTIDNLTPTQPYVFQYLIDGEILVADPYTDQVSDPWDDKNIEDSTYPGLIDYPEGKTENRASVLQTGQTSYVWSVSDFTKPDKEDLVIYELLVRDFSDKHSYQAVIDKLDYLQDLGINALELMPINEFEGNSSWGYNPNFYFAPDKYYGTKNKLKELIDKCHARGIAVILDIVLNHSFNSSPLARMYWNTGSGRPAADNPWYNEFHNFENPDAHWGVDFNHESSYTQNLVDSLNSYWMSEYKVDGFRFDFTKGFGNNFKSNSSDSWGSLYDAQRIALLKRMADNIWGIDSDTYVIFEHLAENKEEQELANYGIMLWGNMNHAYRQLGKGGATSLSSLLHLNRGWNNPNLIGYMESHDEERVAWDVLKSFDLTQTMQRLKLNAAFFFTVPGPKMIWQFEEMGYDEELNNNRLGEKPTHWEYLNDPIRKELFQVYTSLINLKTKTSYIDTEYFTWSGSGYMKWINATHPDVEITIIGNFGKSSESTNAHFTKNGIWYDYFSGETIEVTDFENQEIDLFAGEFRIFTSVQIENYVEGNPAEFVTALEDTFTDQVMLYPNPTRDFIFISGNKRMNLVGIKDISGRTVFDYKTSNNMIDLSNLKPGMYLVQLKDEFDNKKFARVLRQ